MKNDYLIYKMNNKYATYIGGFDITDKSRQRNVNSQFGLTKVSTVARKNSVMNNMNSSVKNLDYDDPGYMSRFSNESAQKITGFRQLMNSKKRNEISGMRKNARSQLIRNAQDLKMTFQEHEVSPKDGDRVIIPQNKTIYHDNIRNIKSVY